MEQTIAPKLSVIADGGVASPAGIHAGGIHAGFRRDPQRFDLALVEVDRVRPLPRAPSPRTSSAPRP